MVSEMLWGAVGGMIMGPVLVFVFLMNYERKYRDFLEMRDGFSGYKQYRQLRQDIKKIELDIYELMTANDDKP